MTDDRTTNEALAVAAVRYWVATSERAERMKRRYGAGPAAARAMDAERLADESRQAAVVAIAALEHSMVEVDGVVYLLQKGIEHGTARIVSFVPEGRA